MTADEAQTQMSMWAMMAAPLVIGSDVRKLSVPCIEMLKNAEVIAVDQDPLAVQGGPVRRQDGLEVWVKPLANGDRAVALLNRTAVPAKIAVTPSEVGFRSEGRHEVRDLWTGSKRSIRRYASAVVPAHGTVMYRISRARGRSLS